MNRYREYYKGLKYGDLTKKEITEEELKSVEDAGYLLKNDEIVVDIDILELNTLKKIYEEFNIKTEVRRTNRGIHLYYKKPDNYNIYFPKNTISALGFKIELLTNITNPNGVVIKQNGKEREVINKGKREELPFIFNLCHRGKYVDCLGMQEGDGRNNKLFIMRQRLGDEKDFRKILNFINKNIFSEELPEKEFLTIVNAKLRSDNIDYRKKRYNGWNS